MKKHRWLDIAEYASVVGLGVGSLASVVYTQMLYVSAPLSLLVLLNLANRRRLERQTEQTVAIATNELDQRLSLQIEQLNQQILQLPTIETVGGIRKSLLLKNRETVEKLSGEIVALQRELQERLKLIEKHDLATLRQDISHISEKSVQHAETLTSITGYLNRLVTTNRVDGLELVIDRLKADIAHLQTSLQDISNYTKPNLTSLQDQVSNLNRQLQKLPPPSDQSSVKQEINELIKVIADLVPKRDLAALSTEIQDLQQRQEVLKQTVVSLETQGQATNQQAASLSTTSHTLSLDTPPTVSAEETYDRPFAPSVEAGDAQEAIIEYFSKLQDQLAAVQTATQTLTDQQKHLREQVHQLPQTLDAVSLQRQMQELGNRITAVESGTQAFQSQLESTLQQELAQVNQQLRSLPNASEFIVDLKSQSAYESSGSRLALEQALERTQTRLILILPWLDEESLDKELLHKLDRFLQKNRRLELGWCFHADRDEHRLLNKMMRGWGMTPPHHHTGLKPTLRALLKLKQAYPDRFQFKVIGTAENFLVSDQDMAIVGIPETLSTNSIFTELQLKLRTTDKTVIQRLIDRFNNPVLDDDDFFAHWNRAVTRYELGDKQGAITDFTHVLELDPDDAIVYNYRGMTRYEIGDATGAIADFSNAIQLEPQSVTAYCNRGFVHLELGNQLAAIADYSLAIQIQPGSAIAYFYRGLASQKFGDLQGAIQDYSATLELNPSSAVTYYYRGLTYQKLANLPAAIADLEIAATLFEAIGNQANLQKTLRVLSKLRSVPAVQPPAPASHNDWHILSDDTFVLTQSATQVQAEAPSPPEGNCAMPNEDETLSDFIRVVDVEILPSNVIQPASVVLNGNGNTQTNGNGANRSPAPSDIAATYEKPSETLADFCNQF